MSAVASYENVWSKHATLEAGVVDTVALNADYSRVEVVNRDGAGEIFLTVDGNEPTVEGDNTHVLPAAIGGMTVNAGLANGIPTVVRLISSTAVAYSVRGA